MSELFRSARRSAPSIVFIDEFQSIFTSRQNEDSSDSSSVGTSLTSTLAGCLDDIAQFNAHAGVESMVLICWMCTDKNTNTNTNTNTTIVYW